MELANLARPEFVILVLFLNGLGSVLKYYTTIENRIIPLVLLGVAFLLETYMGYRGSSGWIDAIVTGGLVNGGTATAIAVFGWDMIYGVFRRGTKGSDKGGNMTLFIGALVLGVLWLFFFLGIWLFEIPQLVALEWVVIVVATAILTLQFQDFFDKILRREKRDMMNIQYLGGLSITLIGVSSWLWWASADTTGEFWWRLGVTFLLGGANVLYMGTVYRKSVTSERRA